MHDTRQGVLFLISQYNKFHCDIYRRRLCRRNETLHSFFTLVSRYSKLTGANLNQTWPNWFNENNLGGNKKPKQKYVIEDTDDDGISWNECTVLEEAVAEINTKDEFSKFEFEPDWMKTKEYWDKEFEARYEKLMKDPNRPPLKVVVTPHSHNDPGWLKTFVNYFQSDTRQILNLAATKMPEFHNMTFIWSEISFLNMWWEQGKSD